MAKQILISPIQLYILTEVRRIRLHHSIPAQELSLAIGKSINYIGGIENEQVEGSYNDTTLSQIAQYLNDKTNEDKNVHLEPKEKKYYTIYDFYPSKILNDEKVIKKVDPIPLGSGPTGTLNALIESTNFFKTARTLNEIVAKANKLQKQNWKASDFTQPLENIIKKKKVLEVIIVEGLNTYVIPKSKKKD